MESSECHGMADKKHTFSLILPAFNEAENIGNVVRGLVENFQKNDGSIEIPKVLKRYINK